MPTGGICGRMAQSSDEVVDYMMDEVDMLEILTKSGPNPMSFSKLTALD